MLCEMPTSVGGPPNKPKKGGPKHLVDQHRSLKNALKSGTLPGMSGAERDASGLPEGIKKMPDGTYKCIICDHPVLLNYFSSHCSSDRHKTLLLLEKMWVIYNHGRLHAFSYIAAGVSLHLVRLIIDNWIARSNSGLYFHQCEEGWFTWSWWWAAFSHLDDSWLARLDES